MGEDGFGTAELYHVSTEEEVADIFTKALTGSLYEKHRETVTGKRPRSSSSVKAQAPSRKKGKRGT